MSYHSLTIHDLDSNEIERVMRRGKIEIKRIENSTSRHVTFLKHRNEFIKEAREISMLYDFEIAIVVFSRAGKLIRHLKWEDLNSLNPRDLISIEDALQNGITSVRATKGKMLEEKHKKLTYLLHHQELAMQVSGSGYQQRGRVCFRVTNGLRSASNPAQLASD